MLAKAETANSALGALRLRLAGVKNRACADFPLRGADGKYLPELVLDFDYRALIPRWTEVRHGAIQALARARVVV